MKKLFSSKYGWVCLPALIVIANLVATKYHFRIDLTQEKRYTLSAPTKNLLRTLPGKVSITIFLEGEMPAGLKKLSKSAKELLEEFKEYGKSNLQFELKKPAEGLDDTSRKLFIDSLYKLGLKPTNIKATAKEGAEEQRMVFPGALLTFKDRVAGVDFLEGQSFTKGINSLNNAEALLEYKFANAIQKIIADSVPAVGYLTGNGEPLTYNVYDLIERTLKPNYGFAVVNLDSYPLIPLNFNSIVIVKPTRPFSEKQKLKIDQYIMYGGKVIWLIDNLYAEMDSLMRRQSDFVAFDRGLNLEDQLFKYGVRINQDLLQDMQCDKIPLVVGNLGNQPQMELRPFPYFPLLSSYSDHPIAKNLDNILSIFPNSIDTVESHGVKKTILLASSENSRTLNTPAVVSFNSIKTEEDLKTFNKSHVPVAVLLEGKFNSIFTNRLSRSLADTLSNLYRQPFLPVSETSNKMIVIANADIVTNVVTKNKGPLTMGFNQFTEYQYANKDFFLNCMEYLVNPSGVLETRSKDFTLRLLDPKKVENERSFWQFINVVLPIFVIILAGFFYQLIRRKKYQR
jgi:ABC-2 type transport system permease protein